MIYKTVEVHRAPADQECGAWFKAPGFYDETSTVSCTEKATLQTTFTKYKAGIVAKKTRKFWCDKCIPDKYAQAIKGCTL